MRIIQRILTLEESVQEGIKRELVPLNFMNELEDSGYLDIVRKSFPQQYRHILKFAERSILGSSIKTESSACIYAAAKEGLYLYPHLPLQLVPIIELEKGFVNEIPYPWGTILLK